MRTNIDIDDELLRKAMKAAGTKTKKDTVEAGLKELVRKGDMRKLINLRGKVQWDGDLDAMRND